MRADGDVRGVNVACPHIHLLQISCLCAGGTGITFVSLGLCKGSRSQNQWYQKAVLLLCFYRKTDDFPTLMVLRLRVWKGEQT